ncbi:molybdenum cofactor guanylyltransferase [Desulfoplanes sp.]
MTPSLGLQGVVLAGGKSTRMGKDKARVVFHGQDLVKHAVKVLENLCDQVWISGRDGSGHGLSNPWFLDEAPGKGPLRGIVTALEHIKAPCMFLPCDLPLMDVPTASRLTHAYKNRPPGTLRTDFIQQATGFIEALVAIYDPGCIPFINRALSQEHYKVARAIPDQFCVHIPYSRSGSRPFLNINYPEDLELLKQVAEDFCVLPNPKPPRFQHKKQPR